MNHPDYDLFVLQVRREDEQAAAAHYRLVKEAEQIQRMRQVSPSLRSLAILLANSMAWLGGLLTGWSCRLQSRYVTEGPSRPCPNA